MIAVTPATYASMERKGHDMRGFAKDERDGLPVAACYCASPGDARCPINSYSEKVSQT